MYSVVFLLIDVVIDVVAFVLGWISGREYQKNAMR